MPSSKDVARKAGVSQTTVSRVLNNPLTVSEKTRVKVMEAIEALGYIPDANARSLVSQKTHTISLISGPLHNPFFVDSTSEIVRYANQLGYKVNVHFSDGEIDSVYDMVLSHKTDGLIMSCVLFDDPIVYRFQKLNLPFVCFNRRHESVGNYVEMDNMEAGRLAVRHLLSLGHRDILWIGGSLSMSTFRHRYLGFKEECDRVSGLPAYQGLRIKTVNYKETDYPDLVMMMHSLINNQVMPTAICAATDALAIELINTLIVLGYSVPDDISVIGIDNVRNSATPLVQLTTIGISDQSQLGEIAIRMLIQKIESKEDEEMHTKPIRITKPVSLFERKTTKACVSL